MAIVCMKNVNHKEFSVQRAPNSQCRVKFKTSGVTSEAPKCKVKKCFSVPKAIGCCATAQNVSNFAGKHSAQTFLLGNLGNLGN